jgi:lysozyme
VRLGDKISNQQAEALLQDECGNVAEALSSLLNVSVNQNQFDALVSFCYNLGIGAFEESTLRKEINSENFSSAANEFERWAFGMVNGVKTKLQGLVNRRNDEKALFLKTGGDGTPVIIEKSIQVSVTWLEAYQDGNDTVLVAWNGANVVEILTLESRDKNTLNMVMQQYKNANDIVLAPQGKAIPAGDRIRVSGAQREMKKISAPPVLTSSLLIRGMNSDNPGIQAGNEIKELQRRLKELGYYQGEIDGDFGKRTDEAVKKFQSDYFGSGEADGKVGPKTWAKLWGEKVTVPKTLTSTATKPYLRLTKTNRRDKYGCYILDLDYVKNNQVVDSLEVCSGGPSRQAFRTGSKSQSESFEPIPEGQWSIADIIWIDGKDNFGGGAEPGVGPAKVPLNYVGPGGTDRSEILFHIDWNRGVGFPGTAGCVGMHNTADMKTLIEWLRDTDPKALYVDWDLGTCPQPT